MVGEDGGGRMGEEGEERRGEACGVVGERQYL
jgi:hypothetical protein